jgi:hypothetical protein
LSTGQASNPRIISIDSVEPRGRTISLPPCTFTDLKATHFTADLGFINEILFRVKNSTLLAQNNFLQMGEKINERNGKGFGINPLGLGLFLFQGFHLFLLFGEPLSCKRIFTYKQVLNL